MVQYQTNAKTFRTLNWQIEKRGFDSEAALKLVADIQAAAKADATVIKGIDNLSADLNLSSEFAKTIKKNVQESSIVSQEFWEQDLHYRQTLCFYESIVNSKGVPNDIKAKYHDAILELGKIRTDYEFTQKKRTGKSQN